MLCADCGQLDDGHQHSEEKFKNLTASKQPWNPIPFPPVKVCSWILEGDNRLSFQEGKIGKSQFDLTVRQILQKFDWLLPAFAARGLPLGKIQLRNMVFTKNETLEDLTTKAFARRWMRVAQMCLEHPGPVSFDQLVEWCEKYENAPFVYKGVWYDPKTF